MGSVLIAAWLALGGSPQGPGFQVLVGGPELDRGVSVMPTPDGGYVAVGVTASSGEGGQDVYLVKLDAEGQVTWTRTFGGPLEDNGWSLLATADGGFLVAGFTSSMGAGDFDCHLIKTDGAGQEQWTRTYGGKGKDRCWAVARAGNEGYVLVGETTSFGAGKEDCYLLGLSTGGVELWSRAYGGAESDRCFSVVSANGEGFVLAGQTFSEGEGDRDAYVLKTDPEGNLEWSRTFGGSQSDVGHHVSRTPDGGFVMTGYTTSLAEEHDDPYLVKVSASGETIWTRVIALDGVNHTLTGAVAPDGGLFLAGFSVTPSTGASSALVAKVDAVGRLQWTRSLLPTDTGTSLAYGVHATDDGGCVVTGHTTEGSRGGQDLLVIKVAAQ